jgi:hypothetical protein
LEDRKQGAILGRTEGGERDEVHDNGGDRRDGDGWSRNRVRRSCERERPVPTGTRSCSKEHQVWCSRLGSSEAALSSRREGEGGLLQSPPGFSHGVYFISANLRGKGIATWAVSTSFYRTGGGLIYALGKVAQRVSDFGSGLPPSVLARWGISTKTYGYTQSRSCVK